MTKAPEDAPALLFLGDNEKNGGADGVTTNDTNFMGRRMGRQHCSSLCSQSEGHGHVARRLEVAIIFGPLTLRRQHCSSLCLQSEGHGHVARRLKSAISSLQSSSPSLCKQSELQCFAAVRATVTLRECLSSPQSSSPSLCKQSELQCFAAKALQCFVAKLQYFAANQVADWALRRIYNYTLSGANEIYSFHIAPERV